MLPSDQSLKPGLGGFGQGAAVLCPPLCFRNDGNAACICVLLPGEEAPGTELNLMTGIAQKSGWVLRCLDAECVGRIFWSFWRWRGHLDSWMIVVFLIWTRNCTFLRMNACRAEDGSHQADVPPEVQARAWLKSTEQMDVDISTCNWYCKWHGNKMQQVSKYPFKRCFTSRWSAQYLPRVAQNLWFVCIAVRFESS